MESVICAEGGGPPVNRPLFAKKRVRFPDPRLALDDGLVCFSDEMDVDILLEAYSFGIFPWPHEDSPILWFSPNPRGVLEFEDFHVSKSFTKFLRKMEWQVTMNESFADVIRQCASVQRKGEPGTWITPHMLDNYIRFHKAGYAHSVEVWENEVLIGGVYGVYVAGVFAGESMFFKKSNASKVAFYYLVNFLRASGLKWMDTQMVTPNIEAFGGKYISREVFLRRIEEEKHRAQYLDILKFKALTPG